MLNSKPLFIILTLVANLSFIGESFSLDRNQPELSTHTHTFSAKENKNHLEIIRLSDSIAALNSGEKDVIFIPMELTNTEKLFLKELKMRFPKEGTAKKSFGKTLNIHGNMSDANIEEFSKKSTIDLVNFFDKYTNATKLGKKVGLEGPKFLSNIILEYSKKLLSEFNVQNTKNGTNCVYIMLKALKANDAFVHYKRWHYDGNGSVKSDENSNLNIVGVFVGLPTIFSSMNDEARKSYNNLVNDNLTISSSLEQVTKMLKRDQNYYDRNSEEYNNLQKEIDNIQAISSSNDPNKNLMLNKLYRRIKVQELVDLSNIRQPEEHYIALFTKEGRNPALHSEPDIKASRLFFALGVDKANFLPKEIYQAVEREAPDPASLKQKY